MRIVLIMVCEDALTMVCKDVRVIALASSVRKRQSYLVVVCHTRLTGSTRFVPAELRVRVCFELRKLT